MKKTLFSLAMLFASITISASAASLCSTTGSTTNVCPETTIVATAGSFDLTKLNGVIIEQTLTFDNGKTATVYYKVEDGSIAVYSETDLSHYSLDDLLNVKETKEHKVKAVKGKRYGTYSLKDARRIAAKWLGL